MNGIKKKEVTSTGKCFVSGCTNNKKNNRDISFHEFPKKGTSYLEIENFFGIKEKVDRHDIWLKTLDLNKNRKVSNLLVCSAHFTKSDYHFAGINCIKQILKRTAVPSQTLPTDSKKSALNERNKTRLERRLKREKSKIVIEKEDNWTVTLNKTEEKSDSTENEDTMMKECDLPILESSYNCILNEEELLNSVNIKTENKSESTKNEDTMIKEYDLPISESSCDCISKEGEFLNSVNNDIHEKEDITAEVLLELGEKIPNENLKRDIGVQVETGNCHVPFTNLIKNDKHLFTLCGISSFKILNEIVSQLDEIYPAKKKRYLDTKNQVILVTMKLKLDISFSVLNVLFSEISLSTCCQIFHDVLKKLSTILQAVIRPVSKSEILNNMPHCFKNFEDTVIVLDCTEIVMQKPKCLKCRIKCYSQYKSNYTFKFMTGVTPGGLLTYVSKSYGGQASDKAIFEQSGILQSLQRNRDAIMVDKGFLIDDHCAAYGIKLIRPPFLRSKQQFSEAEALLNRQIAAARVHVERMNQRIRAFNILNNHLDWNLWSKIDDIFIVCCGLANLNTPIVGDDKFM